MATIEELKALFATGKKPTGDDFALLIDGVKGDKGDKGDTGIQGIQGEKGDPGEQGLPGTDGTNGTNGQDGADGFGTEQQYNDIIARLDAIESRLDSLEGI
ncbi:collagen-like protein [Lederbergia citrisecunda]|uniref:collagen-like triple helix repeat-containing protein n=1 Tax=Lederbergia citrisecunda TaxID=2833583 RepID=UPI003D2D0575